MTRSLFKSTKESPYHLSVGAVFYNDKGEIACHSFREHFIPDENKVFYDLRILMRETVEEDESLERAVLRGIKEEFGSTGEIKRFLGTIMSWFPRGNIRVEKTTVYFLIQLKDLNSSERSPEDAENASTIEWQPIDVLIAQMEEQGRRISGQIWMNQ